MKKEPIQERKRIKTAHFLTSKKPSLKSVKARIVTTFNILEGYTVGKKKYLHTQKPGIITK